MDNLIEITEVAQVSPTTLAISYRALADDGEPTEVDGRSEQLVEVPEGVDPGEAIAGWIRTKKVERARANVRAARRRQALTVKAPTRRRGTASDDLLAAAQARVDELTDDEAIAEAERLEDAEDEIVGAPV